MFAKLFKVCNLCLTNIFVCMIGSNKICVSSLDGSQMKTFLQGASDDKFHSFVVIPRKSMMYFSNHGKEVAIVKIALDATGRSVIIDKSHAAYSSFLTVDRILEKLYWVNTETLHLMSSRLDGSDIRTIIKLNGTSVNGLAVFEDYLYLTSRKTSHIYKFDKFSGKRVAKIKISDPSAIIIYHPAFQEKVYHPCQTSNGGCTHLCFISSLGKQSVHCDCPDTMKRLTDKKTCIPKTISRISTEHGNSNSSSKELIFIGVTASISFVVLVIICATIYRYYRKRSRQLEVRMVFEKDGEMVHGKKLDGKVNVEIKYIPNTFRNNAKGKNVASTNCNSDRTPLHNEIETECMVDQNICDNSFGELCHESTPIIS